jgi:hypothetical protein
MKKSILLYSLLCFFYSNMVLGQKPYRKGLTTDIDFLRVLSMIKNSTDSSRRNHFQSEFNELEKNYSKELSDDFKLGLIRDLKKKYYMFYFDGLLPDSSFARRFDDLYVDTENKLMIEVSNKLSLPLLESQYYFVSPYNRTQLDSLRGIIVKRNKLESDKNKLETLKTKIAEVQNLIEKFNYEAALEIIWKIYPNSYANESTENTQLKGLLSTCSKKLVKQKIQEKIDQIKLEIKNGGFPFKDLNELLSLQSRVSYQSEIIYQTKSGLVKDTTIYFSDGQNLLISGWNRTLILNSNDIPPLQKQELINIRKNLEKAYNIKNANNKNNKTPEEIVSNQNNSQNNNYTFCYGSIAVTLFDGGTSVMIRYNSSGQVVSRVSGEWTKYSSGGYEPDLIKIIFQGNEYKYNLIKDGRGIPSELYDNEARRYTLCKRF